MDNCTPLLEALRLQLNNAFQVRSSGCSCVIETPFSYPDARSLQVFVQEADDGSLELSDDGYAHSYVRLAGVSRDVIKSTGTEVSERLGVETSADEVLYKVDSASDMLTGIVAIVEASQRIADVILRKRLGESNARLDRQIAATLVAHNRVYRKRDRIPVGNMSVDVDYNVLPTDKYQQLSLFSVNSKISPRIAESIAYRAERIQQLAPAPGNTSRVVALIDDSIAFSDGERWRRIKDTISSASVKIIPITSIREIGEILGA